MMIAVDIDPPLHLLRTFEAAARHSNFTRAAAELAVSQPAVSQQIRQLETLLGRALFERSGPSVRLTSDGRHLAASVREGLHHIGQGLDLIRTRRESHHLEIRAISTFLGRWLLPRLPPFLDEHPEIELDLTTSYWPEPLPATGASVHIDFGPTGEEVELVVGPQQVLAVARPDVAARVATVAHLASETLLEVLGGDGWREFLGGLGTTVAPWPRTHRSMTYLHTLELARSGQGVALAHGMIVEDLLAAGELAVVADLAQPSREHYYVLTPPARELNEAATVFLHWLRSFRT